MSQVRMYTTRACPYCQMATRLLERKGVVVERIQVDDDPDQREQMREITGKNTVPQIFIGTRHVGGYRELAQLDMAGELDPLLKTP